MTCLLCHDPRKQKPENYLPLKVSSQLKEVFSLDCTFCSFSSEWKTCRTNEETKTMERAYTRTLVSNELPLCMPSCKALESSASFPMRGSRQDTYARFQARHLCEVPGKTPMRGSRQDTYARFQARHLCEVPGKTPMRGSRQDTYARFQARHLCEVPGKMLTLCYIIFEVVFRIYGFKSLARHLCEVPGKTPMRGSRQDAYIMLHYFLPVFRIYGFFSKSLKNSSDTRHFYH